MAIKYSSAAVADCIQIGRINYLGGQPERCTNIFDWPTEWTEAAKSGQTYTASVDVSSANYEWPAGAYTVSHSLPSTPSQIWIFLIFSSPLLRCASPMRVLTPPRTTLTKAV
jgi:hypothetical protein